MPEAFDPYYRWLGIPPKEQPPNHYRLFGIELFESDRDVIDSVASRHMAYLQEINQGPHVREAQQLLNELATARRCLLDPEKKAAYDTELKTKLAAESKPPKAASAPRRQRTEKPSPSPPPPKMSQDRPATRPAGQQKPPLAATTESMLDGRPGPATQRKKEKPIYLMIAGVAAGVVVLFVVAGLLLFGGGDGGDKTRQIQRKTQREASVDQTATKRQQPAMVDTQGSPDDAVAKAESGTSPLPDVLVEEPVEPENVPVGEQPTEDPSAAAITSDGLPGRIDNLLLWLDASDTSRIETNGDARIDKWNDKSGKDCHATVDGTDGGPELVQDALGGRPVARFSGSQCLQIEGKSELFKTGAEYTFIFVARGQNGTLLSKGSGDSAGSFAMCDGVASWRSKGTNLNAENDDGTEFRVRAVVADQDSLRWKVDSQPNGVFSDADHAIRSTRLIRIGAFQKRGRGLQEFLEGDLAELLVYNRPLADDERRAIEAYLQEKWLPNGTPPLSIAKTETKPPEEIGEDTGQPDPGIDNVPEMGEVKPAKNGEAVPTHERRFVVLTPAKAEASAGSTLTVLDDGVILADGAGKSNEDYRITVETEVSGITAVCLEAMPHDDLPGKGPGYGIAGRFSLAELNVSIRAKDESEAERKVPFTKAVTDNDDAGVERLIDDDDKTSWTVRRRGERVAVVLICDEPIGGEGTSVLTITILNRDNLGRFRLWATSASNPERLLESDGALDGDQDEGFALFVNLGGDAWEDPEGNAWVESKDFDGATFGHEGGQSVKHNDEQNPVAKTAQRGLTAFRAVVPNGTYEVRLYFAEHWTVDPKRRVFAVFVEQQPARRPQNVFLAPGLGTPYIHPIPKVIVTDGRLDVDFQPASEDASTILNGISLRQIP